jgi:predicted amidohydrolase
MQSGENKEHNLSRAESLIAEATGHGACLVALPELFNWRGPKKEVNKYAESIPGPTIIRLTNIALSHNVYILAGSIIEKSPLDKKAFNTSVLLSNHGRIIALYRKLHLFQFQLRSGLAVNEASFFLPGDRISSARLPWGLFGLSICFDLRFPELYRNLAKGGCVGFFVPSAFTHETGALHWEVLLRARAIENQAYILAPNQYGINPFGFRDYGHSMIVGPQGEVLCAASDTEDILFAELDFTYLKKIRKQLPVLQQVQHDGYPPGS